MNTARRTLGLLPRSWSASLDQLRRDVRMVTGGLAGRRVSPFVERAPRSLALVPDPEVVTSATATPSVLAPRTLRIARVVRETADAVSLHLEDTTGAPIAFRPGQFFTVLLTIDGEPLRRAYSVSSAATDARTASITIKRVAGGRVSNHINDTLVEGMSLEVLGPSGSFTVEPSSERARRLVLLAGGSGITPMMAIARTVLAVEPASRVALVYGNRAEADIVFKDALAALVAEHPERFLVRHVLEHPPEGWTGGRGLLARDRVADELDAIEAMDDADYFVCGPEAMMTEARAALLARGVGEERIKEERFASPHLRSGRADEDAALASPQLLTLRIGGEERELNVAPAQTILEAGLAAGLAMPYSCAMGGCAACKVKLLDGEVATEEPNCLTASERGAGYVLACVSRLKRASRVEVE